MCGIVAVVSAYSNGFSMAEADMFRDLLFMDTLRGVDSTGVFGVDNRGNVQIHKEASAAPWFLSTDEYKEFSQHMIQRGKFAVGHNRAATRGTVKDENAHPFCIEDKLILVQNGTFYGDHKHIHDTEVDTEAIAHLLAREPDIEKALQQVYAAYAFIWYEVQTRKLNFLRNDDRPLYVARTAEGGTVFASEGEMISAAAARRKIKLKEEPYIMQEDNLFTMTFENGGYDTTNTPLDTKYRGSVRPKVNYYSGACAWEEYMSETYESPTIVPKETPVVPTVGDQHDLSVSCIEALSKMKQSPTFSHWEMAEMEKTFKAGTSVVLEPYDYIHGNEHKDCTVFHILCYALTPHSTGRQAPFYLTIYGQEEHEVLNLVSSQQLYSATVGPRLDRIILNEFNIRQYCAVYCAMNPQKIIELPHATQ